MPSDFALPPDIVTAHAASLRALARSLAIDEHAADDVVQETWLRALSSPPARHDGIGGWLRRVAEGFALQRRRSESRRAHRERRYARERPEAVTSADARAETLRTVVDAVLSLEDPYRETVLLRWFEGLPPRDIAARSGTSVATVNSRLQRAHALLRERLSRRLELDDRKLQGVLLAIFGTGKASTAAAAASSISHVGSKMTMTHAMLAAGVGAAGLCTFLVLRTPAVGRRAEPLATVARVADAQPAAALVAQPGADETRVAVTAGGTAAKHAANGSATPGPFVYDLTIVPIDGTGRPLSGAEVRMGLEMQRLAHMGQTEWNGELHATWRGFDPSLDMVLEARRPGYGTSPLRRIHLVAGRADTITLAIDDGPRPWKIARGDRESASAAQPVVALGNELVSGVFVDEGSILEQDATFTLDEAGNGVFVDASLLSPPRVESAMKQAVAVDRIDQTRIAESAARAHGGSLMKAIDGANVDGMKPALGIFRMEPASFTLPKLDLPCEIEVTVRDENGQLLGGQLVTVQAQEYAFGTGAKTDEKGHFGTHLPAGQVIVIAGSDGRALAHKQLTLTAGDHVALELVCSQPERTRIHLLDQDHHPLAGWHVESRRADGFGTFVDRGDTDDEGRVALLSSTGALDALFVRPDSTGSLPKLQLDTFVDSDKDNDVVVREAKPAILDVTLDASSEDHTVVEVRVWNTRSHEGTCLQLFAATKVDGGRRQHQVYRRPDLVPGTYVVEYAAGRSAFKQLGPFELASGQELDAGLVVIDAPAQLAYGNAGDTDAKIDLSARVQGMALRSAPVDARGGSVMSLMSGSWTVSLTPVGPDGEVNGAPSERSIDALPGQVVAIGAASTATAPR